MIEHAQPCKPRFQTRSEVLFVARTLRHLSPRDGTVKGEGLVAGVEHISYTYSPVMLRLCTLGPVPPNTSPCCSTLLAASLDCASGQALTL